MPKKTEEEYWLSRAQARILATDRDANVVKADQDKAYRSAREKVMREIDKFYCNFGNAAGMSAEEARQKLSRIELKDFKDELERKRSIIKKLIEKDPNNDELKRYDEEWEKLSKVRELTRKEALEANIAAEIAQLGGKQQMSMDSHLNNVIKTSLKMNSEDLEKVGDADAKIGVGSPSQVKRAAKENWQYSDFSERIWADKAKLIKETRVVIEEGFARNKGAMDMATDLMTRMNVSHSNALRVVRTEFNHLSNQASLEEYKANGIKKYKFVAAIDNRTCSVCHELNGKEFNVDDARVGVNFPPIHPNCRSVTVPVIDWEDEDQWDYSNIELDDTELAEIKAQEKAAKESAKADKAEKAAAKSAKESEKAEKETQKAKEKAEKEAKKAKEKAEKEAKKAKEKAEKEAKKAKEKAEKEAQKAKEKAEKEAQKAKEKAEKEAKKAKEKAEKVKEKAKNSDYAVTENSLRSKYNESSINNDYNSYIEEERWLVYGSDDWKNRVEQAKKNIEVMKKLLKEESDNPAGDWKLERRLKFAISDAEDLANNVHTSISKFTSHIENKKANSVTRLDKLESQGLKNEIRFITENDKYPFSYDPDYVKNGIEDLFNEFDKCNPYSKLKDQKYNDPIVTYTGSSYREINDAMYKKDKNPSDIVKKTIEGCERLLEDCIAPFDMTLARGVNGAYADYLLTLGIGDVFSNRGFSSACFSFSVAYNFACGQRPNLILFIRIPKGTRCADITGISLYDTECEVLFQRGLTLQIDRKSKYRDIEVLICHVV